MTGKIKRRSLRCGGRPKADFGSIFTTFIAPALGVAGSVADSAISKAQASKVNTKPAIKETKTEVTNNNTSVENLPTTQAPTKDPISGLVTSNTIIPPDPTKTPAMRLGGRKKCWIGAAIMGATSIAGSLFGAAAQKREMRRQKNIQDWQNTTQEAANMTSTLNNSQDYQEDYLRQFRTAARLGKTLGAKGIYITDGGDATKIGNNTYLLRGGSHEDVNETGQTGIGINVGGNEVEAEGGEVAQKKNGALRIFSAQPILGNGMSPAQAILRGYNKDKVFSQQQAFKKRNGLKDDGSKAAFGNLINIPDIANKIVEYFSGTGRYASKPVKVTPKTVAKKPIRNGQVGNFRVVNGRYISNEKPLRRVYPEFDIISMGRGLPVGKAAKATARAAKNEVSYINRISKSRLYSDNPIVNTYATYARRYNLPDKARVPYMIRRVKSEEFPSINNGRITMSGGRFKHTNFTYDRPVVSHRKGKWDTAQQTYLINGRTLVSENKGNWGSIEPSDMFTVRDPKGGLTVPTKDVILVSGHKGVLSKAKASGIKTTTSPQLQSMEASITPRESLGRFNLAGGERRHYNTPYWISVNDIVKEYGTPKLKDVRLLEELTGLKSGVSKLDKNAMKIINDAKGFDKLPLNEAEQVMKQTYPNGRGVNFINDRESYITSELPYNSLFYDPATHAEADYVFPKRLGGRCKLRNGGLTSKDRGSSKHPYPSVSSKDFAGGGRSYPIPTKADAVDALRLAGLHGRSDVKAKVYSRYPELRKKAEIGTVVPGGIPGTDSYKQRMYSGYDVSPADLLNFLEYLDRAAGYVDEDGNSRYITGIAPSPGIVSRAKILKGVQEANRVAQAARASQSAQRTSYTVKQAKDFYRDLGINIPVGRSRIYNPTFRSSEIAERVKESNNAFNIYSNNTHLPKGIRLTPTDKSSIGRTAARVINPREAEIVRMGIPISESAKNMTSGANPFLYTPRNSNEVLEGLNRVIRSAGQKAKGFGNKVVSSSTYRNPTYAERVRDANGKLVWKQNYKYKPWVKATAGAAGTAGVIGLGIGLSNTNIKSKNVKAQLDANGKPISQYIARPQTSAKQPSKAQVKKAVPQKSNTVPSRGNTTPQYKGNVTKGNYQLHDGETKTINGIKYTRRGNTIINHKTNVAYVYDKKGNYTGQADYSKVGNFNQAFDAARAAGRKDFIYRAGKYQKYTTNKETDAKKERLNRIIGARRMAKALGGYSRPVKGMRPKALGGTYVPFNKRYTSIYDAPDYDDYNGGNALGNKEVTVTAKRIKPAFMKPNNDAMNIINHPANETPYIPQKHNRSRTIFSGGDYLGLGIDTLAALSTGLVNYNTAGKYVLPDRAPIIQASKLPTTYNVNPEIEEVKRYRDRLTGQTYRNTSSSVAALNRAGTINLDALSNLSKLWATKENEENKMLTQDALNQQTVATQNVQNEIARQSEIARIENEANQAKGEALNVGLSGLSQAWTNFWTAGRTAYEDDQSRRAMIASSKEATPTRLMEMNFDLSPDVIASLYKTSKDDRTKRFYLSRLSPKQRQRYGIN